MERADLFDRIEVSSSELAPDAKQPRGRYKETEFMAVVIRLRKEGKKNRPYFRVVVTDKLSPRDGRFLEMVGTYDPIGKNEGMKLKLDRIDHCVS